MNHGIEQTRESLSTTRTAAENQAFDAREENCGIRPPQISSQLLETLPAQHRSTANQHQPPLVTNLPVHSFITPIHTQLDGQAGTYSLNLWTSLADLRIHADEADIDLLLVPLASTGFVPQDHIPSHAETNDLHGLEFFSALLNDESLPLGLRELCTLTQLFGLEPDQAPATLPAEKITDFENKLRLIANRLRISGSEDFHEQVQILAYEASTNCHNRTAYYLNQIYEHACVDTLKASNQKIGLTAIYNLGVGFYKQARLRAVVTDILTQYSSLPVVRHLAPQWARKPFPRHETVETLLYVEAKLQDALALPVKHMLPANNTNCVFKSEDNFDLILKLVKADLVENDGERLFDFMSTWEPWVEAFSENSIIKNELDKLRKQNTKNQDAIMNNPNFNEQMITEFSQRLMSQFISTKADLIGQATRSFLFNHRVERFERVHREEPTHFQMSLQNSGLNRHETDQQYSINNRPIHGKYFVARGVPSSSYVRGILTKAVELSTNTTDTEMYEFVSDRAFLNPHEATYQDLATYIKNLLAVGAHISITPNSPNFNEPLQVTQVLENISSAPNNALWYHNQIVFNNQFRIHHFKMKANLTITNNQSYLTKQKLVNLVMTLNPDPMIIMLGGKAGLRPALIATLQSIKELAPVPENQITNTIKKLFTQTGLNPSKWELALTELKHAAIELGYVSRS